MNFIEQLRFLNNLPNPIFLLLIGYLICKGVDILLGILKTWKNNNYKSQIMREGIIKTIAEWGGIVFVITIDFILGLDFYLCGFTLSLFVYKEAGSICENLVECGVELPQELANKLEVFNKRKDDEK